LNELAALAGYGFLLGWSVAWPPGPINAEMIRRGFAGGFRPAAAVGLGACSADALWAILVMTGIGLLVGPATRFGLAVASTMLLLILGGFFLSAAWRAWQDHDEGRDHEEGRDREAAPSRVAATRRGYFLGLGMALTSPWNLAFWLAVMGRPQSLDAGLVGALTVAGAVILGAGAWILVLCGFVVRLRLRLGESLWGRRWRLVADTMTGILMLGFAAQQVRLLLG
jgi:threonine/homoserine/homoserine lactone efflux protein